MQNNTTSIPDALDKFGSLEKNQCTSKRDNEAYINPMKNIFQGPFSPFFGLINVSSILLFKKREFLNVGGFVK
jgi:hypothetical protein